MTAMVSVLSFILRSDICLHFYSLHEITWLLDGVWKDNKKKGRKAHINWSWPIPQISWMQCITSTAVIDVLCCHFVKKWRLWLKLKIIGACKYKDLDLQVTEDLFLPCNIRGPLFIPLRRNMKKILRFSTLCRNFLAQSLKCNLLVDHSMLGIAQLLQ